MKLLRLCSIVLTSAVLLEGEKSPTFSVEQGVAQGCSLSQLVFMQSYATLAQNIDTIYSSIYANCTRPEGCANTYMRIRSCGSMRKGRFTLGALNVKYKKNI